MPDFKNENGYQKAKINMPPLKICDTDEALMEVLIVGNVTTFYPLGAYFYKLK